MNAAVVLAGGMSRRMGRPKPLVRLGSETLLGHVLRTVLPLVDRVLVVLQPDQPAEEWIPAAYRSQVGIVRDRRPGGGPLEGVCSGLSALDPDDERALICGCDVPLIRAEFVRFLFQQADGFEAAVPHLGGRVLPLPGVYDRRALPALQAALDAGERSLWKGVRSLRARFLDESAIQSVDPDLRSLLNVNDEAALVQALEIGRFP